jgi:hypothetical protein
VTSASRITFSSTAMPFTSGFDVGAPVARCDRRG